MALALGAYARLLDADHEGVRYLAGMALETGRRVSDRTVEATASYLLGHASLMAGDVAAGLALLDAAMSIVMTGAVQPMYAGTIYCGLLWACREMGDWRRAAQWHTVASRWCAREAVVHFPAHLSAHRAELARIQGNLVEAEQAARAALGEAGDWNRDLVAWAHSLVGEARLALGDLEGARAAFSEAAELGYDPEPGHAHLLFIQGRPEAALRAIVQAVERPHWYAFSNLVYTLPVGVSIAVALGRLDTAALWCGQLEELARKYGTPGPRASVRVARGELALAEGRTEAAVEELRLGAEEWLQAGAPYQSARARLPLARALEANRDWDAARLELKTARATFERIAARHEEQQVRRLIDQKDATVADLTSLRQQVANNELQGLTRRQQEVAALVARGLTNAQVAEELFISRYTAETHVKHILAQLGFSSRAQIAAWASQKGLIERT
jgi:DNA-binding CsgD family transcriptional regulator